MTVGIDMDNEGGRQTQHMAREMGGQMIFIKTDYRSEDQLQHAVFEAAKMGTIKYLANMVISAPDGLGPDLLLQKNARQHKIMLRMPSYLSELTIAHMMKNSDGNGVVGNLAWHPAGTTLPLPTFRHDFAQSLTEKGVAVGRANNRVSCFTINVVQEKVSSLPESKQDPGKMQDSAGLYGETTKDFFPCTLDIANMFIFGFSRYAGCLARGDFILKKGPTDGDSINFI
jgi:3-hydroxybutyrate dehydrogenase